MCGIVLVLPGAEDPHQALPAARRPAFNHWYAARSLPCPRPQLAARLAPLLRRRGPDGSGQAAVGPGWLACSVLALRGHGVHQQPACHPGGLTLGWNGEVFSGRWHRAGSDTEAVLEALAAEGDVRGVLSGLEGPWAAVVWDPSDGGAFWFGRDALGRRSLLASWVQGQLVLASTGGRQLGWAEVPPGLYRVPVSGPRAMQLERISWAADSPQAVLAHHLNTMHHPVVGPAASALNLLEAALSEAVRTRVLHAPGGRAGVLFSGGLDSAVLAALADRWVPAGAPIELVNVSFGRGAGFETPDRLTAKQTLLELELLAPEREWVLVLVDVPVAEAAGAAERIAELIWPLDTVMDHNIGMAFWFGARGQGRLLDGSPHRVAAKPLLMGAGADEQLAGYSRHRGAWERGGPAELQRELQMDLARLWTRNLGRDDRCVSDNGREARYPYLDERVVDLLCSLPLGQIADLAQPAGRGDKMVLRQLAERLGLTASARLVKRAIQFGSRVAKLCNQPHAKGDHKLQLEQFALLLTEPSPQPNKANRPSRK